MTVLQRIAREPIRLLAVVVAVLGLLAVFGVPITDQQTGAIGLVISAVLELVRHLSVPAREVVAQQRPDGVVVAGAAAAEDTGSLLPIEPTSLDGSVVAPVVTVPSESLPGGRAAA